MGKINGDNARYSRTSGTETKQRKIERKKNCLLYSQFSIFIFYDVEDLVHGICFVCSSSGAATAAATATAKHKHICRFVDRKKLKRLEMLSM